MHTSRLAALTAAALIAACDTPTAPAASLNGTTPNLAASPAQLAARGITWRVIQVVPPSTTTLPVGATLRLETIVKFDDGTARNPSTVGWKSSDTAVVSTLRSGRVTAHRPGMALLTATLVWRGLVHQDTVRLTVTDTAATVTAPVPAPADSADDPTPTPTTPADDPPAVKSATPAALPRAIVDTRMPALSGRTISVRAGDDLQAALDRAQPGDAILLANGATYAGSFRLRAKSGAGWIVIRPASLAGIPQAGTRVTPANAAAMPKIVMQSGNEGALRAMEGAGYYRLIGIEVTAAPTVRDFNTIVRLHVDKAKTVAELPHHIIFDRTYIHGQPNQAVTRCVMMNSASTAIIDSYLSECHAKGRDSQAISSWTGSGPFRIENNYLEGAGENVLFGGAKAESPEVAPADIEIRGNHFFKPLAWRTSRQWTIKNLLEIKQGQRILIENNVLENNWVDAQTGRALLIRAADQELSPWSRTNDITVRYNIIRHTPSAVDINAQGLYETTRRVIFTQNLIYDIGTQELGIGGRFFQITGGKNKPMRDIVLDHNTAFFGDGRRVRGFAIMFDGGPHEQIAITNNLFELGVYGIRGSGAQSGLSTLARYAPDAVIGGNVFVGTVGSYSPNDRRVSSLEALNLSSAATMDVAMMRSARAGSDAGADIAEVMRRTASVVRE